jgi:hypothetical protein
MSPLYIHLEAWKLKVSVLNERWTRRKSFSDAKAGSMREAFLKTRGKLSYQPC